MKKITLLIFCLFSMNGFAQNNLTELTQASCLAKGTIITLADGTDISIEEIVVGDQLLTLNTATSSIEINKVTKIHKVVNSKLLKITLANGNNLTITGDHPLLSDKGWVSNNPEATKTFTRYQDMLVVKYNLDSFLYTISPEMKIEVLPIIDIEEVTKSTDTYTLELSNKDATFVANGFFVGQE